MRLITTSSSPKPIPKTAVDVVHGGSNSQTIDGAVSNLNMVPNKLGVPIPNYPLGTNASGLIDQTLIPPLARQFKDNKRIPTLVGNKVVIPGVPSEFLITNYDSFTKYEISSVGGRTVRNEDKITFIPSQIIANENTCIVINEVKFVLDKKQNKVLVPRVLQASPDILTQPIISLTSVKNIAVNSEWLFTDNSITDWDVLKITNYRTPPIASDTLVSIDWLLSESTDPTDVKSIILKNKSTNYTTVFSTDKLKENNVYFIFLRHQATVYGLTDWSIPLPFKTTL